MRRLPNCPRSSSKTLLWTPVLTPMPFGSACRMSRSFCLDVNGTNVFLVEGARLQEEDWGKEVQALADLRLLHEIGNLSVQTGRYRGRRFVGFTLDLSNWTGARSERIKQIEFWTPAGRQDARRASLIYQPGATDLPPPKPKVRDQLSEDEALEGESVQSSIFQLLEAQHEADADEPVETISADSE
jgi:hypothetical protein